MSEPSGWATAASATDELHRLVALRLRRADQRYTMGRRAMVDVLLQAGRPVSIADIAASRPDIPRSSAYRHLVDLQQAGVIRRIAANDEFSRYELAEDLTEHHHHLLCVSCGKVIDVRPSAPFERSVAQALTELADAEGFQPQSHRLDVLGVCAACH